MTKNKFLTFILGLFTICLSACNTETNGGSNHQHTFSQSWNYNETLHWHDATCGHDVKSDEGEHIPDNPKKENEIPATCTSDGSYELATYCSVCGKLLSKEQKTTPALDHDYGTPSFQWNQMNNGGYSCSATTVCKRNIQHVLSETVECSSTITKEATDDEDGTITYTANFENELFGVQTHDVTIEAYHSETKLSFNLNSSNTAYIVEGKSGASGTVKIPTTYRNLPVSSMKEGAFNSTNINKIIIPPSISVVSSFAFFYRYSLNEVVLEEGVQTLDSQCFMGCANLKTIIIPSTLRSVKKGAFIYCSSLEEFIAPNILTIPVSMFNGCTKLKSVSLSDNCTSIGLAAFNDCSSLSSFVFPSKLLSIGESAFAGCNKFANIEIPSKVTIIDKQAFSSCQKLESISLPKSLKSIGSEAFADCSVLETISYAGTMAEWNTISLGTNWKYGVSASVVHCSDGNVAI